MNKKNPVKVVKVSYKERRIPLERKNCLQCGKEYWGTKRQKYCSVRCRNLFFYWQDPQAYRESRLRSYYKQKEQSEKKAKQPRFLSDLIKER